MWREVRERVSRGLPGRHGALVSVVVTLDDPAGLPATMASLRRQRYASLEIVVVGDPDDVDLRRLVARDDRARLDPDGLASATGERALVLPSGRRLAPRAIDDAMRSLERSGSDVAVLSAGEPAAGVRLEDRPELLSVADVGALLARTSLLREGFKHDDDPEVVVVARTLVHADTIDVVPGGAEPAVPPLADLAAAQKVLTARPLVRSLRALDLLGGDVATLARSLHDTGAVADYVEHVPALVRDAPDDLQSGLPAELRVLNALALTGDESAVRTFVEADGLVPEVHAAGLEPAGWTSYLPGWGDGRVDPALYVLGPDQTDLVSVVRGVQRLAEQRYVVDVTAYFRTVAEPVQVELAIRVDGSPASITAIVPGDPVVVTAPGGTSRTYDGSAAQVTFTSPSARQGAEVEIDVDVRAGTHHQQGTHRALRLT